jgi:hypothetical protein
VWGDVDPHGGGLGAGEPDGSAVVVKIRAPRLASLLQTNGGLPVDHQEHIKKQLSMRTLRSASSAEGVCRGSGWGPYPPKNS